MYIHVYTYIELKSMIDFQHAIVTALDAMFTQRAGKTDSVIVQKNHQTVIDCYYSYQFVICSVKTFFLCNVAHVAKGNLSVSSTCVQHIIIKQWLKFGDDLFIIIL